MRDTIDGINEKAWDRAMLRSPIKTYDLFWSPEGRCIATVRATSPKAAIRKAPMPYRRYLGEIYAVIV